jgi:hypothetical protein
MATLVDDLFELSGSTPERCGCRCPPCPSVTSSPDAIASAAPLATVANIKIVA